jgi:hypothetical protein
MGIMSEKSDNQKSLSVFQQNWFVWTVYALSIVVLAILAFVQRDWYVMNRIGGTFYNGTITILRPWVRTGIFLSALFCFIMLWITIRSILCRKHISLKVFNVILALLFLLSPVYRFMSNPSTWRIYDQAVGLDDNSYYFMAWSFMMGGESVLSRLKSKTLFRETFESLQIHYKDSGVGRRMIRPAEFTHDNHLRLYVSKSGYIVGMVANKCYVAYDFNSKRSFGDSNIGELSPFVLIESNTPMNHNDVRDIISKMEEACLCVNKGYEPSSDYIKKSILEKSLDHPNEEVRKLAKQLLDILIEHEK